MIPMMRVERLAKIRNQLPLCLQANRRKIVIAASVVVMKRRNSKRRKKKRSVTRLKKRGENAERSVKRGSNNQITKHQEVRQALPAIVTLLKLLNNLGRNHQNPRNLNLQNQRRRNTAQGVRKNQVLVSFCKHSTKISISMQ